MTVTHAKRQRPARRPITLGACMIGLSVGLYAAGAAAALPVVTIPALGQSACPKPMK